MLSSLNIDNHSLEKSYTKRFLGSYAKLHHFRLFALCVLSFDYMIFFVTFQKRVPLFIVKYLTEWSYLLTFIYFMLACTKKPDRSITTRFSGLFHVCVSAEFLVVLFYWVVVFPDAEFENVFDIYLGYTRHILPFAFLAIDYMFNNIKLSVDTSRYAFLFMFAYLLNNLAFKIVFDMTIYKVITWSGRIIRYS